MIKVSEKENALISENALTAYGRWGSNRNSTYLAEPLLTHRGSLTRVRIAPSVQRRNPNSE